MRALSRPAQLAGFLRHTIRMIKYVMSYASHFLAHDMHSRRLVKRLQHIHTWTHICTHTGICTHAWVWCPGVTESLGFLSKPKFTAYYHVLCTMTWDIYLSYVYTVLSPSCMVQCPGVTESLVLLHKNVKCPSLFKLWMLFASENKYLQLQLATFLQKAFAVLNTILSGLMLYL